MTVKGYVYSQGRGPQESKQGSCLLIHTHKFNRSMLCKGPQFQNSPHKRASMKTMGLLPGLPAALACLRLAGTQQEPGFNLAPLQCKEWHLQWHLPKKSLRRQSISGMLWHDFLPVSFLLPNATNLLQASISIELLPCQLQLGCSSQSVRK